MKISLLSILIVFCIFEVDFTSSDYQSWNLRNSQMTQLKNDLDQAAQDLEQFYTRDIYNFASIELFNLTISSIDNVTNAVFSTLGEIKNYKNSSENNCNDTQSCIEEAKSQLLEMIDNECYSFEKYRNDTMKNLEKKNDLADLRKVKTEIDTRIGTEMYRKVGSCSNTIKTNDDYYIAELCLACRAPKIRMSIITFQENIANFKKTNFKYMKEKVQDASLGIDDYRFTLASKIEMIKKDAYKCISDLCDDSLLLL